MGDMADMVNDDHWDGAELHRFGGTISCKFCYQKSLHWEKTFLGYWRLHDDYGVEHNCEEREAYYKDRAEVTGRIRQARRAGNTETRGRGL